VTTTSVIVVSHRPGDWLEKCLTSALSQADEVILVDNGSAGEEATRIADRLGAKTVRIPVNAGFAAGVNLGVRHAAGDLVGLLNDDAVAGPGWLAWAADLLADPSLAAVTPKVLLSGSYGEFPINCPPRDVRVSGADATHNVFWTGGFAYVPLGDVDSPDVLIDGRTSHAVRRVRLLNHAGMFLRAHGYVGDYGLGRPDDGRFDDRAERFGCSGAAPVFRSETLRRVGPFAEEFFAYNEDFDWCFRARLAGMRILYDPGTTVDHRMSATSGGNRVLLVQRLNRRNQLLTLVRNAPVRVAAEHLTRATFTPHLRGVRLRVARLLPWAVQSRHELRRSWRLSPEEVWRQWAGRDEE
jgi:GT2 family glycosyltransferase